MSTIHEINRRLIDLRLSEFDESELDELNAKKAALEKKLGTLKQEGTIAKCQRELDELDKEIEQMKRSYMEDRKAGRAKFKKKVYISYRSANRPPYHFSWCRYSSSNDYRDLSTWQSTRPWYTPVVYGKDQFMPESVPVNGKNYYTFGDLVWVKCNLSDYLEFKDEERKKVDQQSGRAELQKVEADFEKHGAMIPDAMLNDLR